MPAMQSSDEVEPTRRINGLVFVILLVVLGLGASVALYRWKAGAVGEQIRADRATLPQEPDARLQRWLDDYGRSIIDRALEQLRYSPDQHWILSHTVGAERNGATQEIWGVDLDLAQAPVATREGLVVVVRLPAARKLGDGAIGGDKALNVPHFDAPAAAIDAAFDADARVRGIVEWMLAKVARSLGRDLPGASLVVRTEAVGG
jgi:hypothetical protein